MEFFADLHPKVIHFPIALLFTYAILDILGIILKKEFLLKTAFLLLSLGVVSAFIAVITGNQAAEAFPDWETGSIEVLNMHQTFASIIMWGSTLFLILRTALVAKKKFSGWIRYLFLLFSLSLFFLIYKTGEYGWEMVTKYGIGTDYRNEKSE